AEHSRGARVATRARRDTPLAPARKATRLACAWTNPERRRACSTHLQSLPVLAQQTPETLVREIRRQRFYMRRIATQTEIDRADDTAVDRAATLVCDPSPSAIDRCLARPRVARAERKQQRLRHHRRNDGVGERQSAHDRHVVYNCGFA